MRTNVQAVQAQASEAGQDLELAQALWQLGCVLSDQARWADALAPLRQSLLLMESLEHSDTLDIACVCNGTSSYILLHHCLAVRPLAITYSYIVRCSMSVKLFTGDALESQMLPGRLLGAS